MSAPRFQLSKHFPRKEALALTLHYPERLYSNIVAVTEVRLDGKRYAKRRPAVRAFLPHAGYAVEITPKLVSSATGWVIGPVIEVKAAKIGAEDERILCRLRPDNTLKLGRWSASSSITAPALAAMDGALSILSDDYMAAFRGRADHCGWCRRKLTDPNSVFEGIGPECGASYQQAVRIIERQLEAAS